MPELIGERKVYGGSSSLFITIPASYAKSVVVKAGTVLDVFREGDSLIVKPKKEEEVRQSV